MNLQDFKTDAQKFKYLLIGGAVVFSLLFLLFFGFALIFFFMLVLWGVLVYAYTKFMVKYSFTSRFGMVVIAILITIFVFSWAYRSPSIHKNFGGRKSYEPKLETCTSKPGAPLQTIEGMQGQLYGGKLDTVKGAPNFSEATSIRSFSLKGLQEKTEKNSFYFKISKVDGGYIQGYNDLMEVCNQDNKGSSSYIVRNYGSSTVKDATVTARTSYFHGGKYILVPGTYRVDGYIRNLEGKWVLVAREEGITITE